MYINIAQPDGHPKHVNVTVTPDDYVLLSTDKDLWLMDAHEATELARMLRVAVRKLKDW